MKKRLGIFAFIALSCATLFAASCASRTSSSQSSSKSEVVGKRVYFAAPLFSQAERDYNLKLTTVLEQYEYTVFLPQRDGFLASELSGLTEEEKTKKIFEKDRDELLHADICFALLDGRAPDEGVCVELGIAYANQKRCYGFKTDARSIELDMDLNPMISGCLTKLFYSTDGDAALASLTDYLSQNQL